MSGIAPTLADFKAAMSSLSAFKTWADVETTELAAARIHQWDGEQDGDPIVVIAPGAGFRVQVVTIDYQTMTTPIVQCEFSMAVSKGTSNESVFNTLATSVDAIMAGFKAQRTWPMAYWEIAQDSPARTKASANINFVYLRLNVYGHEVS